MGGRSGFKKFDFKGNYQLFQLREDLTLKDLICVLCVSFHGYENLYNTYTLFYCYILTLKFCIISKKGYLNGLYLYILTKYRI